MANIYSVAISYKGVSGCIDYDESSKEAQIMLDEAEGRKLVEEWLHKKHVINVPHETLLDFTPQEITPLADKRSFQTVLTRLWEATGIHVDWSRPLDYVRQHPRLSDTVKA